MNHRLEFSEKSATLLPGARPSSVSAWAPRRINVWAWPKVAKSECTGSTNIRRFGVLVPRLVQISGRQFQSSRGKFAKGDGAKSALRSSFDLSECNRPSEGKAWGVRHERIAHRRKDCPNISSGKIRQLLRSKRMQGLCTTGLLRSKRRFRRKARSVTTLDYETSRERKEAQKRR